MITILLNEIATPYEEYDFFRSISAQASSKDVYEIVQPKSQEYIKFIGLINFCTQISDSSRIQITLPNNCLVLHKDWDKYINYNLDNGKEIDEDYVKRKLGLVSRPDNGIFPGLQIELKTTHSE